MLMSSSSKHSFVARGKLEELELPSLSTLKEDQILRDARTMSASPASIIGGLKWELQLRKTGNDNNNQYKLYINCNEKCTENFWFCDARFTLYTKAKATGGKQKKVKTTDRIYTYYGCSSYSLESFVIKAYSISLVVEVEIFRAEPKMFALDTNIQVKMANGITKTVAVNRHGLAYLSNYFRNFFFAQWKEKGQEEFVIQEDDADFDIESFRLMIYAALSMGWMVQELLDCFKEGSRMFDIVKMSFKYDFPPLVNFCENNLLIDEVAYPPNLEMLELADSLNLTRLTKHCLAKVDPVEFMQDFSQNIEIRSRLGKRTREELDDILQGCAKKMRYKEDDEEEEEEVFLEVKEDDDGDEEEISDSEDDEVEDEDEDEEESDEEEEEEEEEE